MDLTEAKRLLEEQERCANDGSTIQNALARNIGNLVPGLVAEVERLTAQAKDAPKSDRQTVIHQLQTAIHGIQSLDARSAVYSVITQLESRKDPVATGKHIFYGHKGTASEDYALERAIIVALEEERRRIREAVEGPPLNVDPETGLTR